MKFVFPPAFCKQGGGWRGQKFWSILLGREASKGRSFPRRLKPSRSQECHELSLTLKGIPMVKEDIFFGPTLWSSI